MAKYVISFPSAAMIVPDGEWGTVGRDAHAVIDEAKAAGVHVFGDCASLGPTRSPKGSTEMVRQVRPNNSFKPNPLRGSA
jgi:hypothetical protein